jgi:hypothetical protein
MPGRKKIKIDWGKVEKWIMAGSNGQQVAAALGIHYDTLASACEREQNSLFSEYMQSKREKGNNLLLNKQYELAMKGDKSMLIFLGKVRLNQKETQNINVTGNKAPSITFTTEKKKDE